jgi:hypothetical protein
MATKSDVYNASNCIDFTYFVQDDRIRSKCVHYLVVLYYHTTAKAILASADSVPLLSVYHKVLQTERIECRAGSTSQLHEQAQNTMHLQSIQNIGAGNCSTIGLTRREYTKPWRTAAAACSCYAPAHCCCCCCCLPAGFCCHREGRCVQQRPHLAPQM